MNTTEIYDQLNELWEEFSANHEQFVSKGTKSSARRARKAIGDIKKIVTTYKKQSVDECKN